MARETNANIRAMVIEAITSICNIVGLPNLTLGNRWLRYGRYVVSNTTTPGVFILCVVVENCGGVASYRGSVAKLRHLVSQEMIDAWIAGASGERDGD